MIKNEKEYKVAIKKLEEDKTIIQKQREVLKKHKLSKKELDDAMEPILCFHEQLVDEVRWYENVKRKNFDTIFNLNQIPRLLIALRIASGLTQEELAKQLKVNKTQVSRDERNEYHGISVERAQKILGVFHAQLNSSLTIEGKLEREAILV